MQASSVTSEVFRIFVGGLSFEVDNHKLKESFHHFGNIKKALIIRDQRTGQSKGYGFVTFSSRSSFEAAMRTYNYVNGRLADCYPVLTKGALKELEQRDIANKLFIGGISQNTLIDDMRKYFSSFGTIKEIRILYDGRSGKSRGFGFVLFNSTEVTNEVLSIPEHKIKGKIVEVKKFSKDKDMEFEDQSHHLQNIQIPRQQKPIPLPEPQHSIKTSETGQRGNRSKRRKVQKTSTKATLESLSTISDKERDPYLVESSDYLPSNLNSPENKQYDFDDHYGSFLNENKVEERQEPIQKPNFTLGGFYSYAHSFSPYEAGLSSKLSNSPLMSNLDPQLYTTSNETFTTINKSAQNSWHPTSVFSSFGRQKLLIPSSDRLY